MWRSCILHHGTGGPVCMRAISLHFTLLSFEAQISFPFSGGKWRETGTWAVWQRIDPPASAAAESAYIRHTSALSCFTKRSYLARRWGFWSIYPWKGISLPHSKFAKPTGTIALLQPSHVTSPCHVSPCLCSFTWLSGWNLTSLNSSEICAEDFSRRSVCNYKCIK